MNETVYQNCYVIQKRHDMSDKIRLINDSYYFMNFYAIKLPFGELGIYGQ